MSVLSWDIFCTVIDNYGDIGVCWRLARQLAAERCEPVRLWVDDLHSFARIAPQIDPALAAQTRDGVDVRHWSAHWDEVVPHRVVIEAFACEIPPLFRQAMAAASPPPAWINLEYLSAESWIDDCHGMASPQPPLRKHFFFPGFTPRSGGLLAERALSAQRDAFVADPVAQAAFRHEAGLSIDEGALTVSLFAYENPALPAWLDALASGECAVHVLVPEGRVLDSVAGWAGRPLTRGETLRRGALALSVLPFVAQPDYDPLLWSCDINFIRGEDSFVRAQWAARPLLWHIYPQQDDAHLVKLEAWLTRYCEGLSPAAAASVRQMHRVWNGAGDGIGEAWQAYVAALPEIRAHARRWADRLAALGDLTSNLARFCESLL